MKKAIVSVLLLSAAVLLRAADIYAGERDFPRITFGIEGSFATNFWTYSHFNYIADEGYRVNIRHNEPDLHLNGQLLANAGCNLSQRTNLSVYCGICGLSTREIMMPVSLRFTYMFGDSPLKNRWITFAETGIMTERLKLEEFSAIGKLGGGYRISLSRSVKLDLLMAYQAVFAHPDVSEISGDKTIPVTGDRLRRNNAILNALTFGFGLCF